MDKRFETISDAIEVLADVDNELVLHKEECDAIINWLHEIQNNRVRCVEVVQDISKITKQYCGSELYKNHVKKVMKIRKATNHGHRRNKTP